MQMKAKWCFFHHIGSKFYNVVCDQYVWKYKKIHKMKAYRYNICYSYHENKTIDFK